MTVDGVDFVLWVLIGVAVVVLSFQAVIRSQRTERRAPAKSARARLFLRE